MHGNLLSIALLAFTAQALEFDRDGKALAFDLHRREYQSAPLYRRDNGSGTLQASAVFSAMTYNINITIGTPGQPISSQLDTGSSDFWVPDGSAQACSAGCQLGSFDPKKSTSYTVTRPGEFNIGYGDGSQVSGDFGTDTVQCQDVTLNNVTFGVASQDKTTVPVVSIIGLGYPANENSADKFIYPTFLDDMVNSGKISTHTYSLYLNDIRSTGNIVFGGVDTAKFNGELGIVDLQPDSTGKIKEFQVALTGLSFSNGAAAVSNLDLGPSGAIPVVIDSGATNTILPSSIAFALYNGLGLEYTNLGAVIPCDVNVTGYTLNFTFGGASGLNIGVPLSQFIDPYNANAGISPINGDRGCQFGVSPSASLVASSASLLGDTFLRGVYIVYDLDNKQIAMAPAIQNATNSNIMAIAASNPSSSAAASGSPAATSGAPAASTGSIVSNVIPSASTVQGQTSLSAAGTAAAASQAGTSTSISTSASPTFSGVPSGGFSILPGAKSNAPLLAPPLSSKGGWLSTATFTLAFATGGLVLFMY